MGSETLAQVGDLLFTIVIGYLGALEFLYVVRHIYHWSCGHPNEDSDGSAPVPIANGGLANYEESLQTQLTEAQRKESELGGNHHVMADGVAYSPDGFRINAEQADIDALESRLHGQTERNERLRQMEDELVKQRRIEEETRQELARAEAALRRQRQEAATQAAAEEEAAQADSARKLLEAEREREAKQRLIEEEHDRQKRAVEEERENERKQMIEAERQRGEAEEEAKENERRIFAAEKEREEQQLRAEAEEPERRIQEENEKAAETARLIEAEERERKIQEENEKAAESARLIEAEKRREEEQRLQEEQKIAEEAVESERRRILEVEREREEAAENERRLLQAERELQEKQRLIEEEERAVIEETLENERRLLEAEKESEEKQRQQEKQQIADEEAYDNEKHLFEAENKREQQIAAAEETAENEHRLLEAEKSNEDEQRKIEAELSVAMEEIAEKVQRKETEQNLKYPGETAQELNNKMEEFEENERRMIEAERGQEEDQKRKEAEAEEAQEKADAEIVRRLLEAEREREEKERMCAAEIEKLLDVETERNRRQRSIEENARLFMEAEAEMVKIQEQMMEAGMEPTRPPVVEPPCIKKIVERKFLQPDEDEDEEPTEIDEEEQEDLCEVIEAPILHKVTTQFGQSSINDPYSVGAKSLLFSGLSDEASSIDPNSSMQSSFSAQFSEDIGTSPEEPATKSTYPEIERQEPEDIEAAAATAGSHYSEEYLRSLDGIKTRPLVREDGSGRRRAFKKRRSSGSSNSSRDSRTSREEELKMFTSLEEEENARVKEEDGGIPYAPIKYSTGENTLKVKSPHRRHKRSPAKDAKPKSSALGEENGGHNSLEMLGEESTDPWGEVVPEPYKNTEFWRRKKAMSIDEEEIDLGTKDEDEDDQDYEADNVGDMQQHMLKMASFEEATQEQNEQAINVLKQQMSKDINENDESIEKPEAHGDGNTNLQSKNSHENSEITPRSSPNRSSTSPRLRRSPRIDEMDHYEEKWRETATAKTNPRVTVTTLPKITVQQPIDTGSWRDDHGLMMPGLSDFYDFTASVNPSRSPSTSRNTSPITSPSVKNVACDFDVKDDKPMQEAIDIYDDTGALEDGAIRHETISNFIESLINSAENEAINEIDSPITARNSRLILQNVADDPSKIDSTTTTSSRLEMVPAININVAIDDEIVSPDIETPEDMNAFVQSLRTERMHSRSKSRSRSRSHSPLPTAENISRSLETRREKLIKQNDEFLEKLNDSMRKSESPVLIVVSPVAECHEESKLNDEPSKAEMTALVESLRADRVCSRSRSRSRSPLPTADNLQRSVDVRRQKLIHHNDELFETFVAPSIEVHKEKAQNEECSEIDMNSLVQSLRVMRTRSGSRSRSRSPLPTADNLQRSVETRRHKLVQQNDEYFVKLSETQRTDEVTPLIEMPTISIQCVDSIEQNEPTKAAADDDCTREDMLNLVQSLRVARSRSRSRTPAPANRNESELLERARIRSRTPSRSLSESPQRVLEIEHPIEMSLEVLKDLRTQSRSSSRSSGHGSLHRQNAEDDEGVSMTEFHCSDYPNSFHEMLNLEGSSNRTLSKNTEEMESHLAERQRQADKDALHKLKTASEEVELRTVTPLDVHRMPSSDFTDTEAADTLSASSQEERMKRLRCSPTKPDYTRTFSEEYQDIERMKREILGGSFKRSTYVGESIEFGFSPPDMEELVRRTVRERQQLQSTILSNLSGAAITTSKAEMNKHGARPKTDKFRRSPSDLLNDDNEENRRRFSLASEMADTQRIKDEILASGYKRSTYVGESHDLSLHLEALRQCQANEFRRSRSRSRSPLDEAEIAEIQEIETEAACRELQDRLLDDFESIPGNFQEFSRHLNPNFLESERRASDSALIQKPDEINNTQHFLDPDDYHHYRRFSLNQEQPVEEYPEDDYVLLSQVEIRTLTGSRTWLRADFYDEDLEKLRESFASWSERGSLEEIKQDDPKPQCEEEEGAVGYVAAEQDGEEFTDDSEDERQTVVEVDDGIDEDISDFNERGPTDESHYEQSECEEADRELDRSAHIMRQHAEALEWHAVRNVAELMETVQLDEQDLAEGITADDADSMAIEEMYDEAVRNRKQSGILRDYDSIVIDMQNHYLDNKKTAEGSTEGRPKHTRRHDASVTFVESERREHDMRYLGDTTATERQAVRLRSRYGIMPLLHGLTTSGDGDDLEVDMDYKPKREYNWRKNFKLDDDLNSGVVPRAFASHEEEDENTERDQLEATHLMDDLQFNETGVEFLDLRKYSLGGESITLFSRSPERDLSIDEMMEKATGLEAEACSLPDGESTLVQASEKKVIDATTIVEPVEEKPKKKRSKKKTRKDTEEAYNQRNGDDSENQMYNGNSITSPNGGSNGVRQRRSSSLQFPETDSPKRKSRSRRSSKSSLTNEDSTPRNSVGLVADSLLADINEDLNAVASSKKKMVKVKRKKVKMAVEIVEEFQLQEPLPTPEAVSTILSPSSASLNALASLSPQLSVCVTPLSLDGEQMEEETVIETSQTVATEIEDATAETTMNSIETTVTTRRHASTTLVDTFDILKDANFYPLF